MRAYLLYIRFRLINREVINTIVRKSKMGDWFLFYMLGQNVDSIIFKEVYFLFLFKFVIAMIESNQCYAKSMMHNK